MQYDIEMDLCSDYTELVQDWMNDHGVKSNKTGKDLWYEFFNLRKNLSVPRNVEFTSQKNLFAHLK